MREAFREWYHLDDEAIKHVVKNGTVALDANVLLDLYRVGADRRKEIFGALRDIGDRLWVPYQAAYEYHKNRLTVIAAAEAGFDKPLVDIEAACDKALSTIRDQAVRDEIKQAFTASFESFKTEHATLRSSHILPLSETRLTDPVRSELEEVLTGARLGKRPSHDELEERRKEAKKRIGEKRPPGFGDDQRKNDPTGDHLIWVELLEHARTVDRPILFVTNDSTKGDWFSEMKGRTVGPLPELVAEMAAASPGHDYHQVTLDTLLWLTKTHLGTKISSDTIDTVRDLAPEISTYAAVFDRLSNRNELLKIARSAEHRGSSSLTTGLMDLLIDAAIADNEADNEMSAMAAARRMVITEALLSLSSDRDSTDPQTETDTSAG